MYQRVGIVPCSILVVLLLMFGTAACSGGSSQSPRQDILGKNFSSRAQAVCQTALAQKKAQGPFPYPSFNPTKPDLSKLPAIGRLEARTVQIYRAWLDHMQALGQPPTGQAAWADVLAAVRRNLNFIADQQKAAQWEDGPTFTKDYFEGNKAQKDVERASDAVGVPACSDAAAA